MNGKLSTLLRSTLIAPTLVGFSVYAAFAYGQLNSQPASAAVPFNAGNIIDDATMMNKDSMSLSEIQRFLDAKGSSCSGSLCLKNYTQGGRSAARIIYDVARAYNINPQVLIVTLQKEVGLVTSTSPQSWMYRTAMGFGCPDSTPGVCNSAYYGFTNQLKSAGNFFRAHLQNNPNWYKPHIPGWNNILYHPNASCGTKRVYIENRATSALYSYTPYTPNQAALDAGYGTGNSCSSYGNRNFNLFFRSWFGSPHDKSFVVSNGLSVAPSTLVEGVVATASFTLKNNSSAEVVVDEMTVAMRDESGDNVNFPSVRDIIIAPGSTYTYRQERKIVSTGKHSLWIAIRTPAGLWSRDWPQSNSSKIIRDRNVEVESIPKVSVTKSLSVNPMNDLSTIDNVKATFEIKNEDTKTVSIPEMVVAARDQDGNNVNFSTIKDLALQPGQTYEYSKERQFNDEGTHRLWIAVRDPSGSWSRVWPESSSDDIVRDITTLIKEVPNLSVTRYLRYSPSPALAGQQTGTSFTIKNNEPTSVTVPALRVLAQDSSGKKLTFPISSSVTLAPGKQYQYYEYRDFPNTGKYTLSVQAQLPSGVWSDVWLKPEEDGMRLAREMAVETPNISLERVLKYSPVSPRVGATVGSSFLIRNNERVPVTVSEMVVAGRDKNGNNVNFPSVTNVTILPGETYEYYEYRKFNTSGIHNFWIAVRMADSSWTRTWPYDSQAKMIRDRTATVRP